MRVAGLVWYPVTALVQATRVYGIFSVVLSWLGVVLPSKH